jgi:hypothetical protein
MDSPTNSSIVAVTKTVSDALGTPLDELPPLSRAIDPDALDRLVSSNTSTRPASVTVMFEYAGLKVVVHSGVMVYATPIDDEGETAFDRLDCDP